MVESAHRVVLVHLGRPSEPARILPDSAAAVWQAIDGRRTQDEIVRTVAAEFGIEAHVAAGDVESFLQDLLLADLIRVAAHARQHG